MDDEPGYIDFDKVTQPPFRVLDDGSYERMLRKLQNGSRFEWSFTSRKCDKDERGRCICPKNMNVLSRTEPGRIIRIEGGKQFPVYRAREAGPHVAALGCGGGVIELSVYMSLLTAHDGRRYMADTLAYLRSSQNSGATSVKLAIHLDEETMSGDIMRCELPIHEVERIEAMFSDLRKTLAAPAPCESCG
jgi:hypothetical protein